MSASNPSSKLMLELMVEPDVYGANLWMCFRECVWIEFGSAGFKQGFELALISHMMYLSRVYAKTQFKSKSSKPRESIIKQNSKEWYVVSWLSGSKNVRKRMEFRIKGL